MNFRAGTEPMPSRLYKFMHSRDLGYVLEGETLRVGSSEYYRSQFAAMEVRDPTINDPNEGTVIVGEGHNNDPRAHEAQKKYFRNLFRVPAHMDVKASGNIVAQRTAEFHMISFAMDPFKTVRDALCGPQVKARGLEPYNACVAINDVPGFVGHVVGNAVVVQDARVPPVPLEAHWGGVGIGPVVYEPVVFTFGEKAPSPQPLRKALEFASQQEFRLVLFPHIGKLPPFEGQAFTIHVPGLRAFLEPIDV